jgi:Clostripain family
VCFLSVAGQKVTMPQAANTLKEWALLVYMCADVPERAMHRSSHANLLQMADIGSSDDVAVVAQLANPGPWTYRYIFPPRPPGSGPSTIKPVHALPSVNSGVPGSIVDFFTWATEACPAKNTMLVLWGHGFGIDYYTPWPQASTVPAHKEALFAFGPDYRYKTALDNSQIGDALRACAKKLSPEQKLAIVGFDGCVMAMAEVWSEMRDTAALGIASQAALPYSSWPYDGFLERLLQQPAAKPAEVGEMLTKAFLELYGRHLTQYVTISVCDLALIQKLEDAVKPLAHALAVASADPQARQNIFEARRYCPEYDEQGFIDLGCFCRNLKITLPGSAVSAACDPALQAIEAFVIGSGYSPPKANRTIALSSGVSVWLPPWIQDPDAFAIEKSRAEPYLINGYPKMEFSLTTGWDKFLISFRDQAWAEISEAKRRVHNGGNTMSRKGMGDREMGDREMGDREMGDREMGDREMGDREMGDREMGDREMGDREMGVGGNNAQRVFSTVSSGSAGIILRATVESFGPAGDAELHLTVKWPAASLGAREMGAVPPYQRSQPVQTKEDENHTPPGGKLNAPAKRPAGPVGYSKPAHAGETPQTE